LLLQGPLGPRRSEACPRRRPDSRPGSLIVYISVSAVTATYGFALTASPFWQTPQKEPKGLAPNVRPLAKARRSFAPVSIWGHRPTVCFATTYMRWVRLRRTALRANPQMNTSTQPPEGAGRSRSKAKAKQMQDQKIAASLRSTAPTGKCVRLRSGRPVGRLAFDFDAPPPREAEWRFCVVGNPAWMPG
jgi:hypothetical protein